MGLVIMITFGGRVDETKMEVRSCRYASAMLDSGAITAIGLEEFAVFLRSHRLSGRDCRSGIIPISGSNVTASACLGFRMVLSKAACPNARATPNNTPAMRPRAMIMRGER